jgi:hypothetical protein
MLEVNESRSVEAGQFEFVLKGRGFSRTIELRSTDSRGRLSPHKPRAAVPTQAVQLI